MATSYTRQSSFSDGDTVTAALFNNEYNQLLTAFSYASSGTTGHRHDGSAGEGGNIHTIGDQDFLNKILTTGNTWEFYVEVSSAAAKQMVLQDGALVPHADSDLDLGTSSKYFKDAYIDSITTTGNVGIGGNLTVTGTTTLNGGTLTLGDAATDNVVFGADVNSSIIPNTDSAYDLGSSTQEWRDIYIDGTAYLDAINFNGTAISATAAELNILDGVTSTAAELNILDGVTATASELNLLDGVTATTAELNILDGVTSTATELNILDGVTSTTAELNILDGVTSTAAELNILDGVTSTTAELNILDGVTSTATELNLIDGSTAGTVVNSKAVIYGSSGEVKGTTFQTATNTSGNLLVADGTGFASTAVGDLSEISTVANDDVFLAIDTSGGGLKKITRSAIISGLAVSGAALANIVEDTTPQLGGNLDLNGQDIVTTSNATIDLAPNGTGTVVVRGNTNSGAIVFNCENNSHGQKVYGQPHSAGVTNTLMLPAGANSTLVSLVSTDTLTNKTLTSPKINEDVVVSATATELNILDGVTATTAELNILDGVTSTTAELNILDGVTSTAAELNILDGVTSTAAEINTLDGITAVVGELNALDLGSTAIGTAIASKAVVLDANKDYSGLRNLTITGELDAGSLDVSGDVDVDGTLETDALSINGTAVTSTAAELNILDGVTSTAAELNILDGVTSTAAELNILDGVTSTAAELNILDGVTSTATELNLVDGVTGTTGTGNMALSTSAALTTPKVTTGIQDSGANLVIPFDSNQYFSGTFSDKVVAIGNTGTSQTIDLNDGNLFTATLNGNCTFTLATPNSVSNRASSFTLVLTNDSTANRSVTLAGGTFKYPGGSISRTTAASKTDIWFFFTPDGGTTYYVTIPAKDLYN